MFAEFPPLSERDIEEIRTEELRRSQRERWHVPTTTVLPDVSWFASGAA